MNYILLFIVILIITVLLLRTVMNKPYSFTNARTIKPILYVQQATYNDKDINQNINQNINQKQDQDTSQYMVYTSGVKYPSNDLINLIMKKDYKNIEYKTSNLGDVCETSKNCPDGLYCVFDGKSKYCAKEIPLLKCQGLACNQKIHNLGEKCGKSVDNTIMQVLCNNNEKCMSRDFRNNEIGTCSKII